MTMTDVVLFLLVLVFPLLPGRCQAVLQDAMGQIAAVSPHALWNDAILKRGGRLPARETEERGLRANAWSQPFAMAYYDLRRWWPVQRRVIRRIDLYYDMEHHVWYHRNQEKPR